MLGSFAEGVLDQTANYSIELGSALIVFGILCGFFGKKLVKPVAFLTGFLAGAGLTLGVTVLKVRNNAIPISLAPSKLSVICGAGGIVLGVLMVAFYKFVIYSLLGGLVSLVFGLVISEYDVQPALVYPVCAATFIFSTFLASLLSSFSTIVVTSGFGSFLLTVGIDCILKSGFNHIFAFGFGYGWSSVGVNTSDEVFGLLIFWIVLFLWMGVRQLMAKSPSYAPSPNKLPKYKRFNDKIVEA